MNCVCVYYLPKWIKFSVKKKQNIKKYWKNGKKYWKSQGILSVWKSGNPVCKYVVLNIQWGKHYGVWLKLVFLIKRT